MMFSKKEVAELVGRSPLTIHHWDKWSDEREECGEERFIPKAVRIGKGETKYRYWTNEDVEKIKEFANWVAENRGEMAKYSRRCWGNKDKEISNNEDN